jgi:hypothetical protein
MGPVDAGIFIGKRTLLLAAHPDGANPLKGEVSDPQSALKNCEGKSDVEAEHY